MDGKLLLNEINDLKTEKEKVITPVWKQITSVLIPELSDLDGSKTLDALLAPGYYDGGPRAYLETTSNAIFSLICGPGTNWIQFNVDDPEIQKNNEARAYFDKLRSLVLNTMAQDGFYDIAKPAIKYALALGTSCTTVTKEPEDTRLSYVLWHPGDIANGLDKAKRTDRFYIKQKVKINDLAGYEDLPQKYLDKINDGKGEEQVILYFYFRKNRDSDVDLADGKFKYTVYHVLEDGNVIHFSGMHGLPGSMWLFEKSANLSYGLCPGYYVLRDILQSNKLRKIIMKETEKESSPPMWVPEVTAGRFYSEPGSINYHNGDPNNFPRRVFDKADLTNARNAGVEIDAIVRSHFLVDFFQSLTQKTNRKTAAEVQGLQQEMGAQAAPLVYSVEHNFLRPIVIRTIQLLEEMGALPEPPSVLSEMSRDITASLEFMGPLSIANRYLYKTIQAQRVLNEAIMPIAQFDPEGVKDALNTAEFIKMASDGIGGGFKILRSEKEIEALKQERAALQQQQIEMQQQQSLLQNGGQAPEPGSPLAEEMGNG